SAGRLRAFCREYSMKPVTLPTMLLSFCLGPGRRAFRPRGGSEVLSMFRGNCRGFPGSAVRQLAEVALVCSPDVAASIARSRSTRRYSLGNTLTNASFDWSQLESSRAALG